MHYPLKLTFKLWALAPQIFVRDAQENVVFYVKQKLFKLKEKITVFTDETQQNPKFYIQADRIIDFSARYNFSDVNGQLLGAVKRKGWKSIWKAHYDIFAPNSDRIVMTINEENPWVKVLDTLFAEIPLVGIFTGYVFNPKYLVTHTDGRVVMHLEKQPAFLSRIFHIKQVDYLNESEEQIALLSLLMMILLERQRG
jgi:hypothetical protein